jgi:hypothetical protein
VEIFDFMVDMGSFNIQTNKIKRILKIFFKFFKFSNFSNFSNFDALVIFKKVCETLTPYNSVISKATKTSLYVTVGPKC